VHHGRRCRLPTDILTGLKGLEQQETVAEYHSRQSLALRKAFGWVREAQLKSALRNKARNDEKSHVVQFEKGDQVLAWRPEKRLTAEERKAHDAIPRKYQMRWSRPKTIVRQIHENTYMVRDNGHAGSKSKDRKVHVRHLLHYSPWRDGEEPAAANAKKKRDQQQPRVPRPNNNNESESDNEEPTKADVGDFVLIKHNSREEPFLIGRVTEIKEDKNNRRLFDVHLFGSFSGSLTGEIRAGWIDKKNIHYFGKSRQHYSHKHYTNTTRGLAIEESNLASWGFEITRQKLPRNVLEIIAKAKL
jgi:hypothetical protein